MTFVYTRRGKSKKSDVEEGFSATFENQEEIRANMEFCYWCGERVSRGEVVIDLGNK